MLHAGINIPSTRLEICEWSPNWAIHRVTEWLLHAGNEAGQKRQGVAEGDMVSPNQNIDHKIFSIQEQDMGLMWQLGNVSRQ